MNTVSRTFAHLCLLIPATLTAQSQSAPERTLNVPAALGANAIWSRGYLFHLASDDGAIGVYSTAGDVYQVAAQTRIALDGGKVLNYQDAAAGPSGTVFAATGSGLSADGGRTGLIAFFGPESKAPVIVQLPGTAVFRIVFADDGTLWALVRQYDSAFQELPEYNLLRHYDSNGKLLGAAVPRSSFKKTLDDRKVPMYIPSLTASHDTIGLYLDKVETWMELAYDGSMKGQWQVPKVQVGEGQNLKFSRIYLTTSNQLVRMSPVGAKKPTNLVDDLQKSGTNLVATPLNWGSLAPFHPYFLGVEGEDQVVSLENSNTLHWSKLQH